MTACSLSVIIACRPKSLLAVYTSVTRLIFELLSIRIRNRFLFTEVCWHL